MPSSRRWKALNKRIGQLDADLLPAPSPTGTYSLGEQDRIRAFRLLVHAEIEAFLEEIAEKVAVAAYIRYTTTGIPNRVLVALKQAFCKDYDVAAAQDVYEAASKEFTVRVRNKNHGVKPKDIFNLLLPLGFNSGDFDTVWLVTMETFGQNRGIVAHESFSFQVNTVLEPTSERATVTQIVTELGRLDQLLSRLRHAQ